MWIGGDEREICRDVWTWYADEKEKEEEEEKEEVEEKDLLKSERKERRLDSTNIFFSLLSPNSP